jgi:hypothetical protein
MLTSPLIPIALIILFLGGLGTNLVSDWGEGWYLTMLAWLCVVAWMLTKWAYSKEDGDETHS